MKKRCVYTTNHNGFLNYALEHAPLERPICFFSKKRWVGAKDYWDAHHHAMPVLMRQIEDDEDDKDDGPLACTHVADLYDIKFSDDLCLDTDERRKWLSEKLWLQRKWCEREGENFKEKEVEPGMGMKTFYFVTGLARIEPLPLSLLIKASNEEHLSAEYPYSYSICQYPAEKVRKS